LNENNGRVSKNYFSLMNLPTGVRALARRIVFLTGNGKFIGLLGQEISSHLIGRVRFKFNPVDLKVPLQEAIISLNNLVSIAYE
jgi:hypothetical protein